MKRPEFVNEHIYHIYNRGVEKRNIYLGEEDCLRFTNSLYIFNDTNPSLNFGRDLIEVGLQSRFKKREPFISILAYCLMPNHYHLMVQQKIDNGITEFMRKLDTGYTNFFNIKYDRVGPLFQGKFKAILLENESHFIHLPHYIHLNPLDLKMPEWRKGWIKNDQMINFIKQYRWSSLLDYLGYENFPIITERDFLQECIGKPQSFIESMNDWMSNLDFSLIQNIAIEEI